MGSPPDPSARRPAAEALAEVGRLLAQSLDPDVVAQRIVDSVLALVGGRLATLYRLEESGDLEAVAFTGHGGAAYGRGMRIPAGSGAVGLAADRRRPVTTPDLLTDPSIRLTPEVRARVEEARHRAVLAVPLLIKDRVIGALGIGDREGRVFTPEETALMQAFADQAAVALENARLYAEAERERRDAEELARVSRTLTESLDITAIAERIVESLLPILGLSSAALRLLRSDGSLEGIAWAGSARARFRPGHVVPAGMGVIGRAALEGRPVWSPDVMNDPRVLLTPEMREENSEVGVRAVLAVPLRVKGRVIGVLSVADETVRPFPPREVTLLQAFGDQVALALENARLYAEAERGRREAEAASRAKDEHLAMLGHELRNPLGAIRAAVAALDAGPSDESARRLRGIVARQARHLARLVEDLLDVARLQSGKIVLQPRPVDLKAVAEQCVESLRQAGRVQQKAVSVGGEPVLVRGDPVRLEQAIANLLDNALKYTPSGGRIELTVGRESDRVALRVRDTGVGIEAEMLPRIFDAFTQGERSLARAEGGLGLGLTLVRHIVELHGGTVGAFSAGRGRGSEFAVWLPLASPLAAAPPPEPAAAAASHRHILIIEDNADARDALRMWLEMEGHRVDVAENGPRGLELALASSPEVALIDIGLPGIDGYEVARRLRAQQKDRTPYLVAVTGYGQSAARRDAREAGFDAYLVKPADPADLARILGEAGPRARTA